jgi:hypothetical protein
MSMANVPLFWPGFLLSIVIGIAVAPATSRRLSIGRIHAAVLVASIGLIVSATLTPLRDAFVSGAVGTGTCDLSRIGPPPLRELIALNDTTLNLVLFAPLGLAIGLLPGQRPRRILLAFALVFPFAIETTQLLLPILDRGCQSADVVDNLTGLVAGFLVGAGWRWWSSRGATPATHRSTDR